MISILKTIDWKISLDEDFLAGNVVQARKFPIINQRGNRKICDLNFQIENREGSFQFIIESSPVSVAIFFTASVALLNSETSEKLDETKFGWIECDKGQEIRSSRSMSILPLLTTFKNLIVNVRCEVTSKSTTHSYKF